MAQQQQLTTQAPQQPSTTAVQAPSARGSATRTALKGASYDQGQALLSPNAAPAPAVQLKPASPGTGVIAAGGVRAVLELAGVRDILTKSLGTTNPINLVRATVAGLQSLKTPEGQARLRGISVSKLLGLDQREAAVDETVAVGAPVEAEEA